MKNKGGKPLKFKTEKDLRLKIEKWFKDCEKNERPLTITGLALALDTNRQTLLNYEKKEKYLDTIKKAKLMCENYAEEFLYNGKNVVGAIFNLKNNYNWKDKTETDLTSKGKEIKGFNFLKPDDTNNNSNNSTE